MYCGRIALAGTPYVDNQPGEDGNDRKVWMFPIRPVLENDVKKPPMFVFRDMDDYRTRGASVDAEYHKMMTEKKNSGKQPELKPTPDVPTASSHSLKPKITVPPDLIGREVKHKSFGEGVITDIAGIVITVSFANAGEKKLSYKVCVKNKLLEFI
ncbi:MAG: hypothetical protein LUD82_02300 [Clostridiales bacterium]|nr:hypothetical protein [Clostridiales bacterium]